jgi:hypothetical protein
MRYELFYWQTIQGPQRIRRETASFTLGEHTMKRFSVVNTAAIGKRCP